MALLWLIFNLADVKTVVILALIFCILGYLTLTTIVMEGVANTSPDSLSHRLSTILVEYSTIHLGECQPVYEHILRFVLRRGSRDPGTDA